jgi:hypothetical protein
MITAEQAYMKTKEQIKKIKVSDNVAELINDAIDNGSFCAGTTSDKIADDDIRILRAKGYIVNIYLDPSRYERPNNISIRWGIAKDDNNQPI